MDPAQGNAFMEHPPDAHTSEVSDSTSLHMPETHHDGLVSSSLETDSITEAVNNTGPIASPNLPSPTVSGFDNLPLRSFNKKALLISLSSVFAIAIIGLGSLWLIGQRQNPSKLSQSTPTTSYGPQSISLGSINNGYSQLLSGVQSLDVNGKLLVGNTVVLSPTTTPTNPSIGQIYYSRSTNEPYYYNGTGFIGLGQSIQQSSTTNPCAYGACLSLQSGSPGVQQTGNINISGAILDNQLQVGSISAGTITSVGVVNSDTGFEVNGNALSSSNLSDSSNLALLNRTNQIFTGQNTFKDSSDSVNAFQIQNSGGMSLLNIDTTGNGNITVGNATNPSTITFVGGITSLRPASPSKGQLYYDTSTNQLIQYNGSKWISAPRTATEIVAASNSSQAEKDAADYVATGTADQTTINAALSALPATGGAVYLMEGTYYLSNSINVPDNTTLEGSGINTRITIPDGQNGIYDMIASSDSNSGTNVTIENLKLDGNKANQTAGGMDGIYFGGAMGSSKTIKGATVTDVTVSNLYGGNNGPYLNGFHSNGIGIFIEAISYNDVLDNNVIEGSNYGIFAEGYGDSNYTGNSLDNNASDGIYYYFETDDTITGNLAIGNGGNGFNGDGLYQSTFTGNVADSNGAAGIDFPDYGQDNTITGNTSEGNTGFGVYVQDYGSTVSGNNIYANTAGGISLGSYSGGENIVSGNKIDSNGGNATNEGIYIAPYSPSNSIVDNYITDSSCTSTCYAIDISSSTDTGTYLSGNTFTGDGTNNATIHDVTTSGNIYSGQQLTQTGDASFRNGTNSTTAFQVQNASGTTVLSVDTANSILTERNGKSYSTIGSELMASNTNFSSGWSGTNWSNTASGTTHGSGSTAADVYSGFTPVAGTTYQITFAFSGATNNGSNGITPEIGGAQGEILYDASATSETQLITASTAGSLEFIPTSGWTGTITSVSVMPVSESNSSIDLLDSSGNLALQVRPSDYIDTFIGFDSGMSYSSGGFGDNIGLGAYSLGYTTTGYSNEAIGTYTLALNTTGGNNTAIGDGALNFNTTGSGNIGIGAYALLNNITGSNNTAIGTGTGFGALTTENTANSYDTFLGYGAATINANLIQGSTAIGAHSTVTQNNSLVLGCVNGVNSCTATTEVGIDNTAPGNLLSVGALTTAAGTYQIAVNTNGATNSGIVVQTIASQSSGYAFELQNSSGVALASIDFQGNLSVKNASISGVLTLAGHIVTANASGSTTGAVNANAGTTATCNITGDDTSGNITIVSSGTGQAAGAQCSVAFSSAYVSSTNPVITNTSSNDSATSPYLTPSASGFIVNFGIAPVAGQTYTFDYFNAQ